MKKALLCVLSLVLAAGFVVCAKEELVSVNLSPTGDHTINLGDSIQIEVTTDPAVVDSIVLSGIDVTLTEGSEDAYSTWWKAETTDTLYITATAWLGDENLESEGTLHIVVNEGYLSPYFQFKEGKRWEYEDVYSFTIDYSEGYGMEDTSWQDTLWYTQEVVREVPLQGSPEIKAWELSCVLDDGAPSTIYYRITKDSVYVYASLQDSTHWYSLPSNPKLGDRWETGDTNTLIRTTYEVISEGEEANGYNNCIKIKVLPHEYEGYEGYESFYYWALNVWEVLRTEFLVTVDTVGELGTITIIREEERTLVSFTEG